VWQDWSDWSVDNGAGVRTRRAIGRTEDGYDRFARDALFNRGTREEWREEGTAF